MINDMHLAQPAAPSPRSGVLPTVLWYVFLAVVTVAAGLAGYAIIQGGWLSALVTSLTGAEAQGYWQISRAAAYVSFILITLSMVLGLSITNRLARLWPGGPAANDLHQYTSLLGLAFGCVHALVLLGDHYIGYTLTQILLPFSGTQYRPVWVGIGQIGMYIGLLVSLSFYVRRAITYRWWRAIHFLAFVFYGMVLFHGFFSGTDSSTWWAQGLYLTSAATVLGLTAYRIVVTRRNNAARAAKVLTPSS